MAPRVRDDLPHAVRTVETEWITLSDGTRLAARLWLPEGAGPVPAILEYLPYRLSDGTQAGDHQQMGWFAGHGYACARVDIRGTGNSGGIIEDEYSEQEQLDGLEVIAWLAAQPWCDGKVGMVGTSWSGFNGLQLAARTPPALGAVVSFYASDDRYADDVHYRGGLVIPMDMAQWANCMLSWNALPPDPAIAGDGWREQWRERLERTPHFVERWLAHQRRDDYWRHGSACESYAAIRCPVMAIGGWTDGYTDAALRLLEHLDVPRRGLIGPWGHNDPVHGVPAPAVGSLGECVRFFDRWLKGVPNGLDEEPMLTAWLQDSVPPRARYEERPGRWVSGRGLAAAARRRVAAPARGGRPARSRRPAARACWSCEARRRPGSTAAPGAPTAIPTTCRSTSGPTTAARSASTRSRLRRRSRSSGTPRPTSRSSAIARSRS